MTKQEILQDPDGLTPDELLAAINDGTVSYDELMRVQDSRYPQRSKDKLTELWQQQEWRQLCEKKQATRDEIQQFVQRYPAGVCVQEARIKLENMAWADLQALADPTEDDVQRFIDQFPTGAHRSEADTMKEDIRYGNYQSGARRIMEKVRAVRGNVRVADKEGQILQYLTTSLAGRALTPEDVLRAIRGDHNIFSERTVLQLLGKNGITRTRLEEEAGVPLCFLQYLKAEHADPQTRVLPPPQGALESVREGFTEFYFWGIPSSGKSCAIGALLGAANSGRACQEMATHTCQGQEYRDRLTELFRADGTVRELPAGTQVSNTYEMLCSLKGRLTAEQNGNRRHDKNFYPCALIDMAGELFTCIYLKAVGRPLTDQQQTALDNLEKILITNKSVNRKVHFFVIEYGAEGRKYNGLTQDTYLRHCMEYIEKNNIFAEKTDRVYVLVTKTDKYGIDGDEREQMEQYIRDNYLNFYNRLLGICRKYEIGGGAPGVIPFSIGEVCFQNYCRFDEDRAARVVHECMLDTAYGINSGTWGKLRAKLGL